MRETNRSPRFRLPQVKPLPIGVSDRDPSDRRIGRKRRLHAGAGALATKSTRAARKLTGMKPSPTTNSFSTCWPATSNVELVSTLAAEPARSSRPCSCSARGPGRRSFEFRLVASCAAEVASPAPSAIFSVTTASSSTAQRPSLIPKCELPEAQTHGNEHHEHRNDEPASEVDPHLAESGLAQRRLTAALSLNNDKASKLALDPLREPLDRPLDLRCT